MTIEVLTQPFSVCKTRSFPKKFFERGFCFLARTDHEISVVCETKEAPSDVSARQDGWRALRIQGTLAFALTGIPRRDQCRAGTAADQYFCGVYL